MHKPFLFSLLLLIVSPSGFAQKCDLDVDKIDVFTKQRVRSGTAQIAPALYHWKLTLERSGDVFSWAMFIKYAIHIQEPLSPKSTLVLALADGTVINLVPDANYEPTHVVSSAGVVSTLRPKGILSLENIQALAASPISNLRVVLSGRNVEPNISKKQGEAFQNIARCLLQ